MRMGMGDKRLLFRGQIALPSATLYSIPLPLNYIDALQAVRTDMRMRVMGEEAFVAKDEAKKKGTAAAAGLLPQDEPTLAVATAVTHSSLICFSARNLKDVKMEAKRTGASRTENL